jgi:hypothetical protein
MGAGTGNLNVGGRYDAVLTFNDPIDTTGEVYKCFESALRWLLKGLNGTIAITTNPPGAQMITGLTIAVTNVQSQLVQPDTANFNRAMNRVMWGLRHRLKEGNAKRPGTDSRYNATMANENWLDETT